MEHPDIRIEPVRGRALTREFLDLPDRLYAGDAGWITPMRALVARRLDRKRHPFYDHGEAEFWIARRAGRTVGRISGQINRLHLATHDDCCGHFGHLDAEEDPATVAALLATVEAWARERGMRQVAGPFHLSINEELGLPVAGFDLPDCLLMPHGRPGMAGLVEECGYRVIHSLVSCRFDMAGPLPERILSLVRQTASQPEIVVKRISALSILANGERLRRLFNDAWSGNWGFVPVTAREQQGMLLDTILFWDRMRVLVASVAGEEVGFLIGLPDLNEAMEGLRGRLWPWGWLPFLWRARMKGLTRARLLLCGIVRKHHGTPLAPAALLRMLQTLHAIGLPGCHTIELGWILASNRPFMTLLRQSGMQPVRRFHIYGKSLVT
ncbi:MAG: hypothetical protein HQL96_15230 [Magnetococcales bacterium]|nr:hypothetical protein [Magnetococcales bacterium]